MKLRSRIVLFTLAILVPAMLTGTWLLFQSLERERVAAQARVGEITRALSRVVDREIDRRAAIAEVLASSPAFQAWDLPAFCWLAKSSLHDDLGPVAVRDRDHLLLSTTEPDCLVQYSPAHINSKNFSMQAVQLSELFQGDFSGQALMVVSVPTVAAGQEFTVGLGIRSSKLQQILNEQGLPEGWSAAVVDKRGVVVAHLPDPDLWVGKPGPSFALGDVASGSDKPLGQQLAEGSRPGRDHKGEAVTVFYSASGRYGLTFFVSVPTGSIMGLSAQTQHELWWGAAALTIFCLVFALWVGSRVVEPVEALQQAALSLVTGLPVTLPPTGVVEFAAIGAAMHRASVDIHSANAALERKVAQAVAETQATQQQLLASQKLEAVGRVAGGLAHDFNNLLQTLSTGLHVLQGLPQDARAKPVLDAGLRATHRAAGLVQQMLHFARPPSFERQAVDLRDQLLALQELLYSTQPANMCMDVKMAPDLWTINTDPAQMSAALLNLLFNARDAMPHGGLIHLRAVNTSENSGEWVLIEVRDEGEGIATDDLPHIFEAFFTTKPVGRGTGLGLAQVQRFAQVSGGSIAVSSQLGEGTTFQLRLPREKQAAVAIDAEVLPQLNLNGPCRLLFVEDDPLAVQVVVPALDMAGFKVTAARTAEEALELLTHGLSVDVVFSDIVMPGTQDGLALARRIAIQWPQLPVILATGYAVTSSEPTGIRVLSKPYSIQDLIATLAQVMPSHV